MLAAMQAREATLLAAQRDVARQARIAQAVPSSAPRRRSSPCCWRPGAPPAAAVAAAFLTIAGFEASAALPRAGALAGYAAAGARRVRATATAPLVSPDPPAPVALPRDTTLRFEGVRFRWQPDRAPVLDGLTMEVPPGSRVAILGPSGSGKSTLAALALRLAEPEEGRILLGGVDIATLQAPRRCAPASRCCRSRRISSTIRSAPICCSPGRTRMSPRFGRRWMRPRLGDVVRAPAGEARYLAGRGRLPLFRRPGAAPGARPRAAVAALDRHFRRALRRSRHRDRAGIPDDAQRSGSRADLYSYRASAAGRGAAGPDLAASPAAMRWRRRPDRRARPRRLSCACASHLTESPR